MAYQNQRVKNMSTQEVKKIVYFKDPGPHNTDSVIAATKERVREGDIKRVVVASISGQTALKVAEELKSLSVSVVCVSGFPGWGTIHDIEYPFVRGKVREALEKLKVVIVDRMPTYSTHTFSGTATERFQVLEILAMPREKKWYKTIGVGGLLIKEIEKGETLGP